MAKVGNAGRVFKLGLIILGAAVSSSAVAQPSVEGDILLIAPSRLQGLLHRLPSASSYNHLFEHFYLPSMFSLEENAGFSDIDPELLSIYGHSAFWTEWRLEGLDLTDPLFDGAAAFKVPFRLLSALEIQHGESARQVGSGGVSFEIAPGTGRPKRMAGATVTASNVGGIFTLAYPVMAAVSGIHSRERNPPPPDDRRRFRERVVLHLMDEEVILGQQRLRYAVEIDRGLRHYLDFPTDDPRDLGGFDERYIRASGAFELTPPNRQHTVYGVTEYRARSNLYAERYYREAETMSQETFGFMLGLRREDTHFGVTFKHHDHRANHPGFARELIDLDGEGLFPFQPGGQTEAVRLQLSDRWGPVYVDLNLRSLLFTPERARSRHPLTYRGSSYGMMEVTSKPAITSIGRHRMGFRHDETIGLVELHFDGQLAAFHAHPGSRAPLFFFDVGLETEVVLDLSSAFRPFLLLAKTPVPITTQLASILNPELMSAREVLSDGRTLRTLGGSFVEVGKDLSATNVYTVASGFESELGRGWRFAGQGILKLFDHTHRLVLDGGEDAYGRRVDGIYYWDGGPTRFLLSETPRSEMPLYFGGHLQFQNVEPEEHFFVLSFSVLNSIGHSAPLNGPYGNDIGYLDFSSANPNRAINGRANLDNDRAFVFRLAGGLRIWEQLWGTMTVAHRDGQPFGYYDHHERDGQVATTFATTRGSPLKYTRPFSGPREDFMLSVDVELSYILQIDQVRSLRLGLLAANLLDFGNEIAEINEQDFRGARAALESELPRSLIFSLELLE